MDCKSQGIKNRKGFKEKWKKQSRESQSDGLWAFLPQSWRKQMSVNSEEPASEIPTPFHGIYLFIWVGLMLNLVLTHDPYLVLHLLSACVSQYSAHIDLPQTDLSINLLSWCFPEEAGRAEGAVSAPG